MRWLPILLVVHGACFDPESQSTCGDLACDASFAMVTVTIVGANGQPVSGLATTSTHVATGSTITTSPTIGDGVYVVVDDNFLGVATGRDDHAVRFTATGTPGSVTADYVILAGECDCHVRKQSGPDQLTIP